MSQLSALLRGGEGGRVAFWCPGCNEAHMLAVSGDGAIWGYNGNPVAPTFTPSVLFRTGHHIPSQAGKRCWCDYNREQIEKGKQASHFTCSICHSFVNDGQIQFLGDCTHALAGQTVPLPSWPDQSPTEVNPQGEAP